MTTLMQLAAFMTKLLTLYSWIIWIRIMLSWFNPYPRQGSFTYYFAILVDPFLGLFRSKHFQVGMLDFSPLAAIGILSVVQSLFAIYAQYGTMRLAWVVQLSLNAIWNYAFSIFFFMAILLLIIRFIASLAHSSGPMYQMTHIVDNLCKKIQWAFFPRRIVKETTINGITLAITVMCYFGIKYLFILLQNLAMRIPF